MTYTDTDVDWPDFESINTARGEVLSALKTIERYLDEEGIDDMVGDVKRVRRDIAKRTEKEHMSPHTLRTADQVKTLSLPQCSLEMGGDLYWLTDVEIKLESDVLVEGSVPIELNRSASITGDLVEFED